MCKNQICSEHHTIVISTRTLYAGSNSRPESTRCCSTL